MYEFDDNHAHILAYNYGGQKLSVHTIAIYHFSNLQDDSARIFILAMEQEFARDVLCEVITTHLGIEKDSMDPQYSRHRPTP